MVTKYIATESGFHFRDYLLRTFCMRASRIYPWNIRQPDLQMARNILTTHLQKNVFTPMNESEADHFFAQFPHYIPSPKNAVRYYSTATFVCAIVKYEVLDLWPKENSESPKRNQHLYSVTLHAVARFLERIIGIDEDSALEMCDQINDPCTKEAIRAISHILQFGIILPSCDINRVLLIKKLDYAVVCYLDGIALIISERDAVVTVWNTMSK